MIFTSDNWGRVHDQIMDAIIKANQGSAMAYGTDDTTLAAHALFSNIFGQDVSPVFVATGSASNSLALACLTSPWGAILTHAQGHINVDEAGAPEFFTGGTKLIPLEGEHGKLTAICVDEMMTFFTPHKLNHVVPEVLSLTQGTEAGTIYSPTELKELCDVAKSYDLRVHVDGARMANACAASGHSMADLSVNAGVDVLTLGGTKNGCMNAEAIIFFDQDLAETLAVRQKRAGQTFSKNRFLSAQWLGYFQNDLWLNLAQHANKMASELGKGLAAHPECKLVHPVEINEVFVAMPHLVAKALRDEGALFYDWPEPGDPYQGMLRRMVTSYETTPEEIAKLLHTLNRRSLH